MLHVIGAGLAGLAAATMAAARSRPVTLYEAAPQAGGRCRSFYEPALDRTIDNGNHLILSGNRAALDYLQRLDAVDGLVSLLREFPFVDHVTGKRWRLAPSRGRVPWFLLQPDRRAPNTTPMAYFYDIGRVLRAPPEAPLLPLLRDETRRRVIWAPLAVSALNTRLEEAAAGPFAAVLQRTFMKGGKSLRPMVAGDGLTPCFIEPALRALQRAGATVRFGGRLRDLEIADRRVVSLGFARTRVALADDDCVVLAVPAHAAAELLPSLIVPIAESPILNAHFAVEGGEHAIAGIIGGAAEWVFRRPGLVSTTTSATSEVAETPEAELALLWADARAAYPDLPAQMPAARLVREKRATIACTPANEVRRPEFDAPGLTNLYLAGDWIRTGLPPTIEGAILSGAQALKAALSYGQPPRPRLR